MRVGYLTTVAWWGAERIRSSQPSTAAAAVFMNESVPPPVISEYLD